MRNIWLLIVLLLAAPAWAVDTNRYPLTLVDQTCTDTEDAPAAYTPGATTLSGSSPVVSSTALIQLTGSADTFCDNDSRLRKGALVADTTFGPFDKGNIKGFYLYVDADTVTGGDTTWFIHILGKKPHDGTNSIVDSAAEQTGTGNVIFAFGARMGSPSLAVAAELQLPKVFYIQLDLPAGGATSVTADISMQPWE